MAKKVLIFHTSGGMGHINAAKAIEQIFDAKYPAIEIKNVNIIDYAPVAYQKIFDDGYNYLTVNYPKLWGWFFGQMAKASNRKLPILISKMAIEKKIIELLEVYRPDFIIATHPLPIWLISASKRPEFINIKSSVVVTDFSCHRVWFDEAVDYYFVASAAVAKALMDYGADSGKIMVTGIPIRLKFASVLNRDAIIKKLGLLPNVPTLLIVGGMLKISAVIKIIKAVPARNKKVQFIVVAGRDEALKKALDSSNLDKDLRIKVFGFVENIEELMTAADLIFTKAGGLTASECMALGLPMVFNKVIPGQEEGNVEYLTAQGAAVKAKNVSEVINLASEILGDQKKLSQMRSACQKIGRPQAAMTVADFVCRAMND